MYYIQTDWDTCRPYTEEQEEHLKKIEGYKILKRRGKPCLHDSCTECYGTGVKLDGSKCVHWVSCNCPKCRTTCLTNNVKRRMYNEN